MTDGFICELSSILCVAFFFWGGGRGGGRGKGGADFYSVSVVLLFLVIISQVQSCSVVLVWRAEYYVCGCSM